MSMQKVLLLLASLTSSTLVLANPPAYKVEEFAKTCAAINDESNYDTEFLRKHWRILKGQGNWLANTQMDFPDYDNVLPVESLEEFKRLQDVLSTFGTQLMLVYLPSRGLAYPNQLNAQEAQYNVKKARSKYSSTLETLKRNDFIVPDLMSLLDHPSKEPLFYEKDIHWSIEGARQTALLVAQQLKALALSDETSAAKYETAYNGVSKDVANVEKAIAQICGFSYSPTYSPTYVTTERLVQDDDAFSLFDEVTDDIVLLGTSFSALSKFNFVGYIQEYANTPVANYALSGGGLIGSWINYLKSGDFHNQPPKLIIWEVPGWRDFEPRFFHTFMPLMFDTCDKNDIEMSATDLRTNANKPLNNALFSAEGTKSSAQNLMIEVQAETPHVKSLQTRIWFANGGSRSYTLRHAYRTPNDGQFQALLGNDHNYPNEKIIGVDIEDIQFYESAGENPEARLAIKLCKSPIPYSD